MLNHRFSVCVFVCVCVCVCARTWPCVGLYGCVHVYVCLGNHYLKCHIEINISNTIPEIFISNITVKILTWSSPRRYWPQTLQQERHLKHTQEILISNTWVRTPSQTPPMKFWPQTPHWEDHLKHHPGIPHLKYHNGNAISNTTPEILTLHITGETPFQTPPWKYWPQTPQWEHHFRHHPRNPHLTDCNGYTIANTTPEILTSQTTIVTPFQTPQKSSPLTLS